MILDVLRAQNHQGEMILALSLLFGIKSKIMNRQPTHLTSGRRGPDDLGLSAAIWHQLQHHERRSGTCPDRSGRHIARGPRSRPTILDLRRPDNRIPRARETCRTLRLPCLRDSSRNSPAGDNLPLRRMRSDRDPLGRALLGVSGVGHADRGWRRSRRAVGSSRASQRSGPADRRSRSGASPGAAHRHRRA